MNKKEKIETIELAICLCMGLIAMFSIIFTAIELWSITRSFVVALCSILMIILICSNYEGDNDE